MNAMGGDQDDDEVPDSVDNCPPSFCTDRGGAPEDCHNPMQLDIDEDGVRDEFCDNCSPADCQAVGMNLSSDCFNPSQTNTDGDLWGDVCDLCPETIAPQADGDGDLVGDACDNCRTSPNAYTACTAPGSCPDAQGACIIEQNGDGTFAEGHCSKQLDLDGDGLGGDCDTCPDSKTPLGEANSNDIAEVTEDAEPKGDVCDLVPIAKIDPQNVPEYIPGIQLVQGDDLQIASGALVAANKNAWTAWRLRVDGDSAAFAGVRAGPGLVLDRPVPGELDLVLPIVREKKVEYVMLDPSGFHGGAPCSGL